MIKLRIEGTEEEIKSFLESRIKLEGKSWGGENLVFKSISKFHPNMREVKSLGLSQSECGRIYVDIE